MKEDEQVSLPGLNEGGTPIHYINLSRLLCACHLERAFELMMNEIEKSTQAVPEEKKDDICLIQ